MAGDDRVARLQDTEYSILVITPNNDIEYKVEQVIIEVDLQNKSPQKMEEGAALTKRKCES